MLSEQAKRRQFYRRSLIVAGCVAWAWVAVLIFALPRV
jgi:hypothetical protein